MIAYRVFRRDIHDGLTSYWAVRPWARLYKQGVVSFPVHGTKLFVMDTFYHVSQWVGDPPMEGLEIWKVQCPSIEKAGLMCLSNERWWWMGWWEDYNQGFENDYDRLVRSERVIEHTYYTPWLVPLERIA